MSDIAPISSTQAPAITGAARTRPTEAKEVAKRGSDEVQLSEHARLLSKLRGLPDVRQDVVDRVKDEIDAGHYETEQRLNATVDALLEDLA